MAATSLAGGQDILYYIVLHLAADLNNVPHGHYNELTDSKSARQALARLARVHSSFTRPALAALWRFLWSDKALKHLLCVVGIAQRPPETRHNSWYRLCPVELYGTPETRESRWTRFQEYACLVREIIIDPFVAAVDPNLRPKPQQDTFWYQLLSAFGNAPILPRLEVATLLNAGSFLTFRDSLDTGPLCLLNPVIRELNIIFPYMSGREDETTLRSVLSACFSSRQNVEVLSLELPVRALDIKSLPQSHPHLRHLELKLDYDYGPRIDPNHFTSLATLTTLESLSIDLSSQAPLNLPVTFTRLRNIAVSGYDFRAISALIARVDAPQLRTFSITETHIYSNNIHQELPSYLRMLVAKCPSLMGFHWHSRQIYLPRHGFGGERRAGATLAELIDPLLSLRTIRSFSARFWSPIVPYSSTDFRTIAEAWPELETFHLYDHEDSAGDQYADLESILSFARHCPHLRSLGIQK
ncbi:hypothetical protein LXA43DRAFT_712766 [Ganoderma leucocontextum]|nr:hypothetical protein LXA43DRAFT_712766 [Ganoderma leucocontextum]